MTSPGRSRHGWLLVLVLAIIFVATPARAEKADAVATERYREGLAHYDARRYEEARVAFQQAYAVDPQPVYLLHLGHAELRVGLAALAATHLAAFLRENPNASAADRQEADLDLSAARARVTEVTPVAPDGADVWVDGVSVGRAPFDAPLFVTPGVRTFKAKHGEAVEERAVEVLPGATTRIEFLTASPAPASPPAASPTAPVPEVSDVAPPAGRKPVVEWFADTPAAWVGAGLTGVGLVLGTTFAITAKTHFDRANDIRQDLIRASPGQTPCGTPINALLVRACQAFAESRDTGETQRTIAIVSFAVSGVAAAGTVAFYFLDPGAKVSRDSAITVAPIATDGVRGLALGGRF